MPGQLMLEEFLVPPRRGSDQAANRNEAEWFRPVAAEPNPLGDGRRDAE